MALGVEHLGSIRSTVLVCFCPAYTLQQPRDVVSTPGFHEDEGSCWLTVQQLLRTCASKQRHPKVNLSHSQPEPYPSPPPPHGSSELNTGTTRVLQHYYIKFQILIIRGPDICPSSLGNHFTILYHALYKVATSPDPQPPLDRGVVKKCTLGTEQPRRPMPISARNNTKYAGSIIRR